jgi:hypothetical protein
MKRYFFDVKTRSNIQYDFCGRDFGHEQQALQYAELIALDVQCLDEAEYERSEVQVRDIGGEQLFAVPVRPLESHAG